MPDLLSDAAALQDDDFCGDAYLPHLIPGKPPVATIRSWRGRGMGPPFFRLAGSVVYRVRDVREWVERCRVDTGSGK